MTHNRVVTCQARIKEMTVTLPLVYIHSRLIWNTIRISLKLESSNLLYLNIKKTSKTISLINVKSRLLFKAPTWSIHSFKYKLVLVWIWHCPKDHSHVIYKIASLNIGTFLFQSFFIHQCWAHTLCSTPNLFTLNTVGHFKPLTYHHPRPLFNSKSIHFKWLNSMGHFKPLTYHHHAVQCSESCNYNYWLHPYRPQQIERGVSQTHASDEAWKKIGQKH